MPPSDAINLPPDDARRPGVIPLLIAGGLYQCVLALTDGRLDPTDLRSGELALAAGMLVIGLVVFALVRSARRAATSSPRASRIATGVALVALIAQATSAAWIGWFWTGSYLDEGSAPTPNALVLAGLPIIASSAAALLAPDRAARRLLLVIAALNLAMGGFVARQTAVAIDVQIFQDAGAEALLSGRNPYAITFANPSIPLDRPNAISPVYSAEVQRDGRLLFGFPYLPLSLLAVLPAYALMGDPRFALAAALAGAGLLIAQVGRGRAARCAAVVALTAPAGWRVVQSAWTEPLMMLALAGVAIAACRGWRAMPIFAGVFFATKQYTFIYLPLLWLLLPRPLATRPTLRWLGLAALAAAAVTLPLALWDARAFWHSAFAIQLAQPFRPDSLSLLALYARLAGAAPPMASAIAFAAIVPAWAIALRFAPRDAAGFTLGVAATTVAFLFFSRQAFLNYHSFAAYAVLLSVATIEAPPPITSRPQPAHRPL